MWYTVMLNEPSIVNGQTPDQIQDDVARVALIRERMLTAHSRQKSYADRRRRPLEFGGEPCVVESVSDTKRQMLWL